MMTSGSLQSMSSLYLDNMMTSSKGNFLRVTGPFCGQFTGHRWIPLTKASDAELLMFSLIWAWTNGWVNNRDAGYLRRHRTLYDVTAMKTSNVVVNHTGGNVCYIPPRAFRIKWQIPPVPLNKSVRYIRYSEAQCSWSTHRACIVIISKLMHIHKSNLCDLHSNAAHGNQRWSRLGMHISPLPNHCTKGIIRHISLTCPLWRKQNVAPYGLTWVDVPLMVIVFSN